MLRNKLGLRTAEELQTAEREKGSWFCLPQYIEPSAAEIFRALHGETPAATVSAPAALSGTWSGQYSGSYQGSFTPVQGSSISFGTVGSSGITYPGKVSGGSMSGSYQVNGGGQSGGPWSASKTS